MDREQIEREVREGQQSLTRYLVSEEGGKAMAYLCDTIETDPLVPGDPFLTHFRLGQLRVLKVLKQIQEDGRE